MKRIAAPLLIFIALLIPAVASAQFRYAPVAGVTISDLKFKQPLFNVDQIVGFQAGIMGEMMFPGIGFGIDIGLLYNQMGAKADIGSREIWHADGFGNENIYVHTLDIPVHLRFKWTRMMGFEDYLAPFVYGGPNFSIQVGHNSIKGNEGAPNPFRYSGGDIGLTAGGGAEIFKRWQVSLQYTWGMSNVLKTRKLDNLTARNREWAVRVAYMF